jgi:hypothetical protein
MENGNRMKNWFHEHKLKLKVICGMNNNAMPRQFFKNDLVTKNSNKFIIIQFEMQRMKVQIS